MNGAKESAEAANLLVKKLRIADLQETPTTAE
jgi:hypothetical protein